MLFYVGGCPLGLVWMAVMGVPGYQPVVQKFSFFKRLHKGYHRLRVMT